MGRNVPQKGDLSQVTKVSFMMQVQLEGKLQTFPGIEECESKPDIGLESTRQCLLVDEKHAPLRWQSVFPDGPAKKCKIRLFCVTCFLVCDCVPGAHFGTDAMAVRDVSLEQRLLSPGIMASSGKWGHNADCFAAEVQVQSLPGGACAADVRLDHFLQRLWGSDAVPVHQNHPRFLVEACGAAEVRAGGSEWMILFSGRSTQLSEPPSPPVVSTRIRFLPI